MPTPTDLLIASFMRLHDITLDTSRLQIVIIGDQVFVTATLETEHADIVVKETIKEDGDRGLIEAFHTCMKSLQRQIELLLNYS